MNKTLILFAVAAVGFGGIGCSQKTPEEAEAAKYPQTKPLTPEEQQKANALSSYPSQAQPTK